MKQPDGTTDIIGTGMLIGSEILGIIKDNMPTKHERKVIVGLRRLKNRFKEVPVDVYVRANFDDCTEERQLELITYYRSILDRN